jgi:predicted nucleic acid-binding protein
MTSHESPKIACVIDSDIAIDYIRGEKYAIRILQDHVEKGAIVVSTLTHFEVYRGMRTGEESLTDSFLDTLFSVDVDVELAREGGKLINGLRSRGLTIDAADAIIAATAIRLNVPLITNNISHYPFPDLNVIRGRDWSGSLYIKERRRKYKAK